MLTSSELPKVSKIAIINPYLQRGLVESSEVEATERFIVAAKNIGIQVAAFKNQEDVYDFNPDFIIPITYQEPKLTPYPTYGLLIMPVKWVAYSPRFMRNILTYDGYFAVSPVVEEWLKLICGKINKNLYMTDAVFTVPKTEFKPLDLTHAKAAYFGVNWDGLRHHDLFKIFESGDYLQCFGPKESWSAYSANLYGGKIPFDGFSTLNTYANLGAGLCINHPDHDNDGIPTCRIFEIVVSSAVAICTNNSFYQTQFGDSVLYVDKDLPTNDLADAIKEKIDWIRMNPKQAQDMAKIAHDTFNRNLSLEVIIQKMVDMHSHVIQNQGYIKTQEYSAVAKTRSPKLAYIVPVTENNSVNNILNAIQNQTYSNIHTILLAKTQEQMQELSKFTNNHITTLLYSGANNNRELFTLLVTNGAEWISLLKTNDKIFSNHAATLINTYQRSAHDKLVESTVIVFSNSLEHSTADLTDKIQDPHMLYLNNKTRVGNVTPLGDIPLCAVTLKLTQPMIQALINTDFNTSLRIDYATSQVPLDVAVHANDIVCSASITDPSQSSILIIHNATSIFNFNNQTGGHGGLLVDERQKMYGQLTS